MNKEKLHSSISEENANQIATMRQNFKRLRQEKGLSIEELSHASGIRTKILADIEEGRDFEVQYLILLCRLYQIQPHRIFFGLD
ncbi:MAG: helix-turn-helix domain-containing protein [Oscillospiraceae bacterium]|nr:helix-turn-helix domain-containing protein [Oscillospiraceae bacterium]